MAVGAGRNARLCRFGGVLRSDPEADLSLQEKRHPACYPAGCDLRVHSAGDGPGGLQGQRQNAAHGPLRQRRTGDRPRVRPAGHAGLQVHVRRDPLAGGRHGSAPVTLRFSSFFSIDKRGCAGGHSLFCLSVAFGISPAPRCTRSRALHPWGWLPPARSCGPGTALQRPWHTLRSQPQSR